MMPGAKIAFGILIPKGRDYMPEVSPIGKRIKAYREQAGLSQHGL
jgi:hypothetical protein